MEAVVAFIITNKSGTKHKGVFEALCTKSIKYAKQNLKLPVVVASYSSKDQVDADEHVCIKDIVDEYENGKDLHGLITAELVKTHIQEWSPADKTLYVDCDAFVMRKEAIHYLDVLDLGYDLSVATCVTQDWKDCIAKTVVSPNIIPDVPPYFPYWNFGIFGSAKKSQSLLERIRHNFLSYCYGQKGRFMKQGGTPHAQAALVNVARQLAPNHKIFTMPARYNCHFDMEGGYVFNDKQVILHMWKDIRSIMI